MTLKEKIIEERNLAIKSRDKEKSTLLGTLLGELDRQGKNPNDDMVLSVIKKMTEGCKECGDLKDSIVLETYLPKIFTEEELILKIKEIITNENLNGKKDLGKVMKSLKDNYANLYDGRIASQLAGKILE